MHLNATHLRLSATDLANHLECRYLTLLNRELSAGKRGKPTGYSPRLETLAERGLAHERAYIDHLRAQGRVVADLTGQDASATTNAMRSGADIIQQGTLENDHWRGIADVLIKISSSSDLGDWSYEVVDTKLASETKAGTVLQLCLYSDLVAERQGVEPERTGVVSPGTDFAPEWFRLADYAAYYRQVKVDLENTVAVPLTEQVAPYPEPIEKCETCRWWSECDKKRHDDDHLSLVAGLTRMQRRGLEERGMTTLEAFATAPKPAERPERGSLESLQRGHHQAAVQLEGRKRKAPYYELLPGADGEGLSLLPEPAPGDMFFDLEGDPFVADNGLEYLFGWVEATGGTTTYHGRWSTSFEEEKATFEAFIDFVMERWKKFPTMHVYHYAPYEPSALKRLMGRYGTREEEVDQLLRSQRLVDLYRVVRQGVRCSVESYSIKRLEEFYGYDRDVNLKEVGGSQRQIERALELGNPADISGEAKTLVQGYNQDDCVSTWKLRDWLEEMRAELGVEGDAPTRPDDRAGDANETLEEELSSIKALMARLAKDVSADPAERTPDEHARWLLAQLLEYHRREDKAGWWEFFRLKDLPDEELLEERAALAYLQFDERVGGTDQCPTHRYNYPPQDFTIEVGGALFAPGAGRIGTVEALNPKGRTIDITKKGKTADVHPSSVYEHTHIPKDAIVASLVQLGEDVAERGIDAAGARRVARDIVRGLAPRLKTLRLQIAEGEILQSAKALAMDLDRGALAVQGPPGAGKTYTGARMIAAFVGAGFTVGITALSHEAIKNFLDEAFKAADEMDVPMQSIRKVSGATSKDDDRKRETTSNKTVANAMSKRKAHLVAGTQFMWARPEFFEAVDVLFIDEAGQMPLADVLASSHAAKNVVLLGDPAQLEQPRNGTHPDGCATSALDHLLNGHKTLPKEMGLFLPKTYRLHPNICDFTSELFYENRLTSVDGLEHQALGGKTPYAGAGLHYLPVEHAANTNQSNEEVTKVVELFDHLTTSNVTFTSNKNKESKLAPVDILIIAPYNAQVDAIAAKLPDGARVGTVDKFQGQQAPVVIYSMATSTPEDAPRGMEFLYSPDRLNVATSRAKAVVILIAAPALFRPACRTPRQMRLANAFCRYLEMSGST